MKKLLKLNNCLVSKILISYLFISCDFTPLVHREIIEAQGKIKNQKYREGLEQYKNILKGRLPNKLRLRIYYQIGELYAINIGDYRKSIKYFREIKNLTSEPKWLIKAEERIAEIYLSFLKEYDKSTYHYKKLYSFKPKLEKFEKYEFFLALSYYFSNNFKDSKIIYKKIKNNIGHQYHKKAVYYLGLINFHNKKWNKAISYWQGYLKKENRKDNVVQTKFLIANAYEMLEQLDTSYRLYYSILGDYPNTEIIKNRLKSIYARKIARKR